MAKYKIAEYIIDIDLPADEDPRLPGNSYEPFRVADDAEGELLFKMNFTDTVPDKDGMEEIGNFDGSGANTGVYRDADKYLFDIYDIYGTLCATLVSSHDFASNTIRIQGKYSEKAYGLGNALMIAYAFSGALRGVLLLHSSVTMKGGRAYLFLGKSGTGKSTHSRMWLENIADTELLNDDNPALRVWPDGSIIIYGTPWSGKTPCYKNKQVPAGAFVRIEQHPDNQLVRHAIPEAFASILSSCSTMIWDKPTHNGICQSITEVLRVVPSYTMKCRPDSEAAHVCHKGLMG